jgi:peroxiredoxin
VLVLAVATAAIGAVVWSRTIADGDDAVDDTIRLDAPGEYTIPGASTNPPARGEPLPAVELLAVDDSVVELAAAAGRPMVVNLWYSTCPPCARELADFARVHAEVGEQVRFVGVNPLDPTETMVRFARDRGVTYELFRDPDAALANALDVVAYPVTLFVDPDGTIVDQTGPLDAAQLRERIETLW